MDDNVASSSKSSTDHHVAPMMDAMNAVRQVDRNAWQDPDEDDMPGWNHCEPASGE